MRQEIKQRWMTALTDGSYQQCREYMMTYSPIGEHKFCPLGVLQDLYHKEHGLEWGETRRREAKVGVAKGDRSTYPSEDCIKWAEGEKDWGLILDLAVLDKEEKNFSTMAKFIDKNF